jgi:hypothetical protein
MTERHLRENGNRSRFGKKVKHGVLEKISTGRPWHNPPPEKTPYCKTGRFGKDGFMLKGLVQGLMLVATANFVAWLPSDRNKPIVYIDYVESAPWNIHPLTDNPRYRGVGKRLIWAAVRVSQDVGFQGKLGLHSLPQSVGFYEGTCGMVRLGPDPNYEGLDYFEMTPEQAQLILIGGVV